MSVSSVTLGTPNAVGGFDQLGRTLSAFAFPANQQPNRDSPENEALFQFQGLARILNGSTNLSTVGFRFILNDSQQWQALEATTAAIRVASPNSPALDDARQLAYLGILTQEIPSTMTSDARVVIDTARREIAAEVLGMDVADIGDQEIARATHRLERSRDALERNVAAAFVEALASPSIDDNREELARVASIALGQEDVIRAALQQGMFAGGTRYTIEDALTTDSTGFDALTLPRLNDPGLLPLGRDTLSLDEAVRGIQRLGLTFTGAELSGGLTPTEVARKVHAAVAAPSP